MPKSKHRKDHKSKVNKFKTEQQKARELLKKRMIEDFVKKQQELMESKESHTSTKESIGPEIDVETLNNIEEIADNNIIEDVLDINELTNETEINGDNNNKG